MANWNPTLDIPLLFQGIAANDVMTIINGWGAFLAFERGLSHHTCSNYALDVRYFMIFIQRHVGEQVGVLTLCALTLKDTRAYMAHRHGQGFSARSTARAVSALRSFLAYGRDRHGVSVSFMMGLRSPKVSIGLPHPLSIVDAVEVSQSAPLENRAPWMDDRDHALFTLLYGAGLRISEALDLNVQDVIPMGDVIPIRGKGNKDRLVPILPVVAEKITKYIDNCPYHQGARAPDGPLFLGFRGGRFHRAVAAFQMRRLRLLIGLPASATLHSLRHSFATHLLQGGTDLRTLQELLGHNSLSSTQNYTKLEDQHMMDTYARAHPRMEKDGLC